ncbi:MAG: lipid II:glycine glycyltransferase FemX [bacterium]
MEKFAILTNNQLNLWDDFVYSHPFGWIGHLSSWQRVLGRTTRINNCYNLVLIDEVTGQIKAGLPLYLTKSLTFKRKLIGAPLTTIYDPLISTQEQMDSLLKMAKDLLKSSGGSELRIKALQSTAFFNDPTLIKDNEFRYHYLDLGQDLEVIWKNAHRSCIRQHVNKAEKNGVVVRLADNENDLKTFYRLYASTRKRNGLPAIPYAYFESIWDIYKPKGYVYFLLALYNNSTISALMAFRFKNRFSAEAIGWDMNFKWLTPSAITFWQAIKLAKELGCISFDFGRTSIQNNNLIAFKRHWGTKEIEMPQFVYKVSKSIPLPENIKEESIKKDIASSFLTHCPNFFFEKVGNFYYRYFAS